MRNDVEKIARVKRILDHAELLSARYPVEQCREMVLLLIDRAKKVLAE